MRAAQTQNELVLRHLLTQDHLTALQAIGVYGIYRLAGRVYDLNTRLPHPLRIHAEMTADATGKRYARYRMGAVERGSISGRPLLPSEKHAFHICVRGRTFTHDELLAAVNPRRDKGAA